MALGPKRSKSGVRPYNGESERTGHIVTTALSQFRGRVGLNFFFDGANYRSPRSIPLRLLRVVRRK